MQLCDLPEDILVIVLRRCLSKNYDAATKLKRNLPLLAVCQLWRRLAIPMVYSHVYVQYGKAPKFNGGTYTRDPSVDEPADVAVKSNLDLVAMVGCASAVRSMRIDVYCLVNPFPGWRVVIQRMRAVASKWRVVELRVAMYPDFFHYDGRRVEMVTYVDDIAEVGDALAALMPDVRRLGCGGINDNPIAKPLYGRLAGHYADQLQLIKSQHPMSVPQDRQLTKLQKVSICYGQAADYQLPPTASDELVDINLVNGPSNHSWTSFSTDSSSRVIEFAKLKRLCVVYHTTYKENGAAVRHRDGHLWELHFPSLERLDIHCTEDVCPLLEYAVLPPRMESISIDLKSATFQQLADVVLPATKRLSLGVSCSSNEDARGLPTINRLLERARGGELLELRIEDPRVPVVPESITCTALTHLLVSGPTSADTMFAFIERLPKLAGLTLYRLNLSDIQIELSIPKADKDVNIEPLSMALKALAVNFDMGRDPPETAVAMAKYVLLRIPTLTRLVAAQTPKDPVLDFVDTYTPRYPYLGGVELVLYESEDCERS